MIQTDKKSTKPTSKTKRVNEDILIYIDEGVYLKFTKVFAFNESQYVGHLDIWYRNAPFYVLFTRKMMTKLKIKGYNKCFFINNTFRIGHDKSNKMYLRCVEDNINCKLNYHTISSISDIRELVLLKQSGNTIFPGFEIPDKEVYISKLGEAIELIKTQ